MWRNKYQVKQGSQVMFQGERLSCDNENFEQEIASKYNGYFNDAGKLVIKGKAYTVSNKRTSVK